MPCVFARVRLFVRLCVLLRSCCSPPSAAPQVRPQAGAPPGEVDDLFDRERLACVDLCCGAWHTLLLMVPRDEPWEDPLEVGRGPG